MKKGRNFYASLLLFTAALCPLSGSPAFGTGPVKAAESTVSVPKKLLASVKKGYVKLRWSKTAGADHYIIYRKAGSGYAVLITEAAPVRTAHMRHEHRNICMPHTFSPISSRACFAASCSACFLLWAVPLPMTFELSLTSTVKRLS